MRSLFILILALLSSASCAKEADKCKQVFGEDKRLPPEVVKRVQLNLKDRKLIDRKECETEIFWLAIPANQPTNKSRAVGSGQLVVFNKKTKEILVLQGQ